MHASSNVDVEDVDLLHASFDEMTSDLNSLMTQLAADIGKLSEARALFNAYQRGGCYQ
jgi:hypothetical protein